ncbi:hypothetical protein QBC40DRAFT_283472 [Triangularia verruculosa]|uniref:Uncharacterized protein n=1 Tax=Triangularia verruculosa TaxID=2587418 RepID=A0AAN6XFH5_9PEZI|nr:hypothetical protein QBC40DRAFT_283472 [Triangularia verruculosa]
MAEIMEPPYPSTPSPSSRVRTPPAPHLGYSDSYEPYTPRKSSRIANRTANQTPSPRVPSSRRQLSHPDQPEKTSEGSPESINQKKKSTMATPSRSPQKKPAVAAAMESPRRTLTAASVSDAASALGFSRKSDSLLAPRAAVATTSGMLITPAKTPQKPPTEESKAKVEAFARTLFRTEDEVMPTPKRARNQTHTLDSFTEPASDESFQIHVDSNERIPEVDRSIDNPFYVDPSRPAAPVSPRRSQRQRQMVSVPGEGKISLEEAIQREDGLVTVL